MKDKRYFFSVLRQIARIAIVMCSVLSVFFIASAKSDNYQLDIITQLNLKQGEPSSWLQLISHPGHEQQHFVVNGAGQMYLVDGAQQPQIILDLSTQQQKTSQLLKLTALELHPNFSLRDQPGYGLFYTAHLEALDENMTVRRIQERGSEIPLKFDAVITEWKFNAASEQKVALNTKREVLRISVPDSTITIKQIAFNPYIKSWNEGFGLLYVALNGGEKWNKPLYSGVVLRINPAKFGLRSYTVPTSNPYMQNSEIKDEIYLLGGQDVKQFIWPDKSSDNILLSHYYQSQLLSLSDGRDDWRNSPPKAKVYQGDDVIKDVLLYRGRQLPYLRNKLLILTKNNQQWRLASLNIQSLNEQSLPVVNTLQQEWPFSPQDLSSENDINLSINRDGEILLFDKTAGMIFQLSQKHTKVTTTAAPPPVAVKSKNEPVANIYIILMAFIAVVISLVVYSMYKRKNSVKKVVRTQFANIKLNEAKQQIDFYHRHQKTVDTFLEFATITRCEVQFNEQVITEISTAAEHGFNATHEQNLRETLTKERVHKMVHGKIRQVSLFFTDNNNKNYTVCLYMRKGSERITKKTYTTVIDDVIDWCWLISEKINPDNTEKRKEKPIITAASLDDLVNYKDNEVPLHHQAAAIRATISNIEKTLPNSDNNSQTEQVNTEAVSMSKDKQTSAQPSQQKGIDTEVVNALEKLVNLKQQGFLTDEEFTKAKENLLRGLFDE